jgi:hypothetical protein
MNSREDQMSEGAIPGRAPASAPDNEAENE